MRILAATALAALLIAPAASPASAQMNAPKAAAPAKATPAKKSLFERLGGEAAIKAVVDDFVANVAADTRINSFFGGVDIPRLKKLLVEQICAGTGGPCTYTGRDMKTTHKGMGVADKDFNALVEDLDKSLVKFKVPAQEKKELVAILAPMRKDIVEKK
jgi:hemoglobin